MRSAIDGTNPTILARLSAGFAAIGDVQFLPGYCVLLTDRPGVERLSDLERFARLSFLDDMDLLGEAIERVCSKADPSFRRVNLEILGNTHGFLHAHAWPRYEWEPDEVRHLPVWLYPSENWSKPEFSLSAQHDQLRRALAETIADLDALRKLS
ncbi:diadenosine tetraphosphate hydrolase [Dietzia timorensis]|uniref:diadenosine tetraphosphate hydrolase n=1 Tax=Dietzia timorensis TaxID=499555 RepID=UPI000A7D0F67|nr:diadenosine tetraphosphate hydrolase [Dietzia timorensis]